MLLKSTPPKQPGHQKTSASGELAKAFKPVALPALVAAMQVAKPQTVAAERKELPAILRQEALTD
ncbi:hypothetical protein [Microvirga flavescens]|uniref:hypothetical protein n=1 Tax=Microvirga flavescens TaxID=2249811 RepID=UPI000DD9A97D|nr:hypothetical protein [Microvirga flavescens]